MDPPSPNRFGTRLVFSGRKQWMRWGEPSTQGWTRDEDGSTRRKAKDGGLSARGQRWLREGKFVARSSLLSPFCLGRPPNGTGEGGRHPEEDKREMARAEGMTLIGRQRPGCSKMLPLPPVFSSKPQSSYCRARCFLRQHPAFDRWPDHSRHGPEHRCRSHLRRQHRR